VSSEPGTSTLTATYEAVVEETSRTDTATGTKQWAAIDLVKTALVDEDEDGFKTVTYSTDPDVENPVITYEYTITNIGPVDLTRDQPRGRCPGHDHAARDARARAR
jgi:hypothetical protein